MLKLLISVELITTHGQIRSNESLEILRNLLTVIVNSADLSAGLKGNAVKMKRKETWARQEDGEITTTELRWQLRAVVKNNIIEDR